MPGLWGSRIVCLHYRLLYLTRPDGLGDMPEKLPAARCLPLDPLRTERWRKPRWQDPWLARWAENSFSHIYWRATNLSLDFRRTLTMRDCLQACRGWTHFLRPLTEPRYVTGWPLQDTVWSTRQFNRFMFVSQTPGIKGTMYKTRASPLSVPRSPLVLGLWSR